VNYTKAPLVIPDNSQRKQLVIQRPELYDESMTRFVRNFGPKGKARAAQFIENLLHPPLLSDEINAYLLQSMTDDKLLDLEHNPLGVSLSEIEFLKQVEGVDPSFTQHLEGVHRRAVGNNTSGHPMLQNGTEIG